MSTPVTRREFLTATAAGGLGFGWGSLAEAHATHLLSAVGRNNVVRVACIGLRGKGRDHIHGIESVAGAEVVALCDVDRSVLHTRSEELRCRTSRDLKRFVDYRELLDDRNIDAVSVATPNHTHAPIAIAAMAAGKDVYVEKPCSHSLAEGYRLVAAARRHGRLCQHGTQARSSPAVREAVRKLREGVIGRVLTARATCVAWRPSQAPSPDEPVPSGVNYDLWLGPAARRPFARHRFHHYWRWHGDYGNGELGNQGLHQLDVARWGLGVGLPRTVKTSGGQFMFDDDRPFASALRIVYAFPEGKRIVFETRPFDSREEPSGEVRFDPRRLGPGVTFHGSQGTMHIRSFEYATWFGPRGEPGPCSRAASNEYERFIVALRSRDPRDLGADVTEGHLTAALCHLGNTVRGIGFQLVISRGIGFQPVEVPDMLEAYPT